MVENQQQIDEAKRVRLISAAIDEFSKFPFDKASTNSIVKRAGISKGLLYHYFRDKKDLFHSAAHFVTQKLYDQFQEKLNWDESDLFLRIKEIILLKADLGNRYPGSFNFIINYYKKDGEPIDLDKAKELYSDQGIDIDSLMQKIYSHNIDYSLFKNPEKVGEYIEIIQWTLEGVSKKIMGMESFDPVRDLNQLVPKEIDKYIEVLKGAFYK